MNKKSIDIIGDLLTNKYIYIKKTIMFLLVYTMIFNIGEGIAELTFIGTSKTMLIVGLSFLTAGVSKQYSYFLFSLSVASQLSNNIVIALIFMYVSSTIILTYVKVARKEKFIILLTIVSFIFNIQYAMPVIGVIIVGTTTVVPIMMGVLIVGMLNLAKDIFAEAIINTRMLEVSLDGVIETLEYIKNYSKLYSFLWFNFITLGGSAFIVNALKIKKIKKIKKINVTIVAINSLIIVWSYLLAYAYKEVAFSLNYLLIQIFFTNILIYITVYIHKFPNLENEKTIKFEDESNMYIVKIVPIPTPISITQKK